MRKLRCLLNVVVFSMLCWCPLITPSNIMVVSPGVSKSHFKVAEAIVVGLADAGHHVTLISAYDYKPTNANIEPVQLTGAIEKAEEMQEQNTGVDSSLDLPIAVLIPIVLYFGADMTNFTLAHPNVKALSNRNYDLVIVEIFGTDALIGLGQQFNAPVIGFGTFGTSRWTNDLIGNPAPLSYVQHPLLDLPHQMNIWHRLCNTFFFIYESILLSVLYHPLQRSVYNSIFPDANISYDEARKSVSLIFANSHFSLARPLPYGPNTIEVGGMNINRKARPLPQDIKDFIESAKDGVVYFSVGTYINSTNFPIEKRNAFINNFAKMKQKIIWKFEDDTVPMPENVYTSSWLPQSDILSHPNVRAFIAHGGILGATESIYYGVPIVGIPFFGDQKLNVRRAEESGWAVHLDYNNITEASVEWALNEILNNKKYSENAKITSQRYRDQPMTPVETMVYWSEYVIRHKGAPQLRSSGLDLNYFQYHNLDVFAIIIAFIVVVVYAMKWSISKLCCCKSKGSIISTKKNN